VLDNMGAKLRRWRRQKGLSQAHIAEKAGVSQALVSQVEAGKKQLPLQAAQRLITECKVPAEILLNSASPSQTISSAWAGWTAYDTLHARFAGQLDYIVRVHKFLSEHKHSLLPLLRREEGRNELTNLLVGGKHYLEHQLPPLSGDLPESQEIAGKLLPKNADMDMYLTLVNAVSNLRDLDRQLIIALVERLGARDYEPRAKKAEE
jgi:transcriptional regulator with XRE-family HTH domain